MFLAHAVYPLPLGWVGVTPSAVVVPLSGPQAGSTVPIWKLAGHLGGGVSVLEGFARHY